jgi:opacity protein-like surface antigen
MNGKLTIAAATVLALMAGAASAQGLPSGLYGKVFGGANWAQDQDITLRDGGTTIGSANVDFDTGYTLGAALGYNYTSNFAVEAEYAYRNADIDGGGDATVNAVMFNGIYTLDGMGPNAAWKPYLGAGVGGSNVELDGGGSFSDDLVWAYQLIGGVGYEVTPQWTLTGEVRWFGTESTDLDGPDDFAVNTKFESVDLLVGAAYKF